MRQHTRRLLFTRNGRQKAKVHLLKNVKEKEFQKIIYFDRYIEYSLKLRELAQSP